MDIEVEKEAQSPSNTRPPKISTCPLCSKTFFRKAHMLRHVQQHTGDRPYVCKFCSKTFKRSDVLRDHFSRCERRGDNPVPKQEDRGRKRHACDPCARLKVKCDSEAPCKKCVDFGRECVRSRARNSSMSESDGQSVAANDITSSDRNSIGFLLNCSTNVTFKQTFPESDTAIGTPRDSSDEVMEYMPTSKAEPGIYGSIFGDNAASSGSTGYDFYDTSSFFGADTNLDNFLSSLESGAFEGDSHWHRQIAQVEKAPYGYPNLNYFDWDSLEVRSLDIRQKLSLAASELRISHNPLSLSTIYAAIESITARRIESWVKLYFRHWQKHGTFLHESSFNTATVALPLLLAVMCIGGMYSKDENEVFQLKMLLDVFEYYIYTNPGLGDEYNVDETLYPFLEDDNPMQQHRVEELQGAYLIIVVQYWTGDRTARKRARQSRFPRVVAIARSLYGPTAQHEPGLVIENEHTFRRWVQKESLIRLMSTMIMLDNAFVLFCNLPQRFEWNELDIQLPSDPQYFALASYEQAYTQSRLPKPKMKVKSLFEKLFVSTDTEPECLASFKGCTLLDLQILIHFLYAYIWRHTFSNPIISLPSVPISQQISPLKTALQNWKCIWDEVKTSTPLVEWNEMGFQRAAESYWNLTKAVLLAFEKRDGDMKGVLPMESDCEECTHLKKLLGGST